MIGEYIPSNQGTTRDIYGGVRSSAVDGRSPYVTSNYGTVDTLQLRDGRQLRVSAVDGESPYIVTRNNPHCHCAHTRSNPGFSSNLNSGLASAAGILFGVPLALVIGGYMGYRSGKSGK
jgi:hypothetical protein